MEWENITREDFVALAKIRGIIGAPDCWEDIILDENEKIDIETGIKGDTVARAYWRNGCMSIPMQYFVDHPFFMGEQHEIEKCRVSKKTRKKEKKLVRNIISKK
jgi:hypothetical protein